MTASFQTAAEALDWFADGRLVMLRSDAPPIGATGEPYVDRFTAMVFAAAARIHDPTFRSKHLREKAEQSRRYAIICATAGDAAVAESHRRIATVLDEWAAQVIAPYWRLTTSERLPAAVVTIVRGRGSEKPWPIEDVLRLSGNPPIEAIIGRQPAQKDLAP